MLEDTTAEDLMDAVRRYAWLLNQLDEPFPPEVFKLQRLLDMHGLDRAILTNVPATDLDCFTFP